MTDNDRLKNRYFANATQYYATARFAAIGGINPLAGLLFHYSLEMFLKGHLCLTLTDQERKNLSHRLEEEVWPAFKNMIHDSELDRYDSVISSIDSFWELRYPEEIVQTGMSVRIGFGPQPPVSISQDPEPHFELDVDKVDSLVALIFKKSDKNPKAFKSHVLSEARDYLSKWNKTDIW